MEIWKDIENYIWIYQISNFWRVKSLKFKNNRILKPWDDWYGYKYVNLRSWWKTKQWRIHRLKAIAFIPNPNKLPCVCHRDNNPSNNWYHEDWNDNLYRGSYSDNNKYPYECWRKYPRAIMLWKFGKDNHLSKKVKQYTMDWKFIKIWNCISEVQRNLWYAKSNISACCLWKTSGAYWYKRVY